MAYVFSRYAAVVFSLLCSILQHRVEMPWYMNESALNAFFAGFELPYGADAQHLRYTTEIFAGAIRFSAAGERSRRGFPANASDLKWAAVLEFCHRRCGQRRQPRTKARIP